MCCNWFVTVFVYYALSLNVQDLGGNLYVNFFISGMVEFPAIILCMLALKKFGRRTFLSATMIVVSVASLAGNFQGNISKVPKSKIFRLGIPFYFYVFDGAITIRVTLAMVGKFAATCGFAISYIYSSEIYPTVVRQVTFYNVTI